MRLKETVTIGIESVISVWRTWNLHGFVLLSLLLQFTLYLAGPLRKKTSNGILVVLIWSAYLLVQTVISRSLTTIKSATRTVGQSKSDVHPYGLWAVCLLLHFGGPDTITALAMEDNDLWSRVWIQLVTQVYTTGSILAVAVRPDNSPLSLLASTLLISVAGLIKSFERVTCLKESSLSRFRWSLASRAPDPGPDYAAIVEEHKFYKNAGIPAKFVQTQEEDPLPLRPANYNVGGLMVDLKSTTDHAWLVKQAYRFYKKFKGMYVDMVFCCHDRMEARDVFLRLSPQAAFTILETEMKFAFEAFYTKYYLANLSSPWKRARFLSFVLELAALCLWFLKSVHYVQYAPDIQLTSSLLVGAVLIDAVSLVRLYLSDWKIACSSKISHPCLGLSLFLKRRRWGDQYPEDTPLYRKFLRILFRQWSESISQFNFIHYCIHERPECLNQLYTYTGAKDMMDGWKYVSNTWLTDNLREFIFKELKHKSSMAEKLDTWEEVSSSRGRWSLRCANAVNDLDPVNIEPWIMDVEYDESLLIWHIATELCYETDHIPNDEKEQEHRRFSKTLSDYMMYLCARQPKLISEVAPMAGVILKDTREEARRFFHEGIPASSNQACQRMKQVPTHIPPSHIKEEDNNSVLFDACRLAKNLSRVGSDQWKLISQVWVELVCYAAGHSPGSAHAMLLTQGGELVTLVRLLMLHLGLTNQFRKAKCIPRAELVVDMKGKGFN